MALPGVGVAGQRRLASARVLIVGLGGLGTPVAQALAGAGVGRLGLADFDHVALGNLHRQPLYAARDVGARKVDAARARLLEVAPEVQLDVHPVAVDAASAPALVAGYDVVVDGTDALPVRYALSDACVAAERPLVHGSVSRFEGRATVLAARGAPCYRCLWPEPAGAEAAPTCDTDGVLGPVPGFVGMLQAAETLKLLLELGEPLVGRLLVLDALRMTTHTFVVARDPGCPTCGASRAAPGARAAYTGVERRRVPRPTPRYDPWSDADGSVPAVSDAPPSAGADRRVGPTTTPSISSAISATPPSAAADALDVPELSPAEVAERLRAPEPPLLLDVREPWEYQLAHVEGARLIPLNSLPAALSALDPGREYVVMCHHGMRSMMAARFLKERGMRRVLNLRGGIDAWSALFPDVPRY
jgi:adenylyltransferase/sulfurtransferase